MFFIRSFEMPEDRKSVVHLEHLLFETLGTIWETDADGDKKHINTIGMEPSDPFVSDPVWNSYTWLWVCLGIMEASYRER